MVRRKAVSVLVVLLCASALCWSSGAQETPGKVEAITLNFWFPTASAESDSAFMKHAADFSQLNPSVKVVTTAISSHGMEMEQKLNTSQLAGTFPDVFSAVLFLIGTRGAKGDFLELTDYFNKWEDKSDIMESAVEMGMYKGKMVGLGYFPAPIMNVYRKDFYAEAGLDPSKGPSTWEELRTMSKKATVYDSAGNISRAGADVPSADGQVVIFEAFARNAGSQVIDEVNQLPAFTDNAAIEALQFLADLRAAKVSYPFHLQDFGNQPFINNRSALGMVMPDQITQYVKDFPENKDKLGYAPSMSHRVKKNFCGYRLFTIGVNSKYPSESWDFIRFMMSTENMQLRVERLAIPPARNSMAAWYTQMDPERHSAVLEYIQYGKGKPITPWTSIYSKIVSLAYEEAMAGKKTARQALLDADADLRLELKKVGFLQ